MNSSMSFEMLKPNILPIATVLIVLATVPLAIMPMGTQIKSDFEEFSEQNELLEELIAKADSLAKLDIDESRRLLQDTVQPALPAEPDPSGALAVAERIAQEVEISITAVSYSGSPSTNNAANSNANNAAAQESSQIGPEPVLASITLSGDFVKVSDFIRRSERALRVLDINALHITKSNDEGIEVVATIDFSAPYLPHPTDLGPVEDPLPMLTSTETATIDIIKQYEKAEFTPTQTGNIVGKVNPF